MVCIFLEYFSKCRYLPNRYYFIVYNILICKVYTDSVKYLQENSVGIFKIIAVHSNLIIIYS